MIWEEGGFSALYLLEVDQVHSQKTLHEDERTALQQFSFATGR